jgi:hypothetical protein
MSQLETALSGVEADIAEATKAADALAGALRRLRAAAKSGQVAEVEKQAALAAERGAEAATAAARLPSAWTFDARAWLADGYVEELRQAAADAGVNLIERDGRIYSFPLLLRVEPRDAALRIGKKLERRIRPAVLARQLAAMQKRPQRFREDRFLELLYRAYELHAGRSWLDDEVAEGPVVPLADLHEVLTLMPGTDYGIEEFARDLLLLDRKPDLKTRANLSFRFVGSTLGKGRMRRVTVYDEAGRERSYLALRFVREG